MTTIPSKNKKCNWSVDANTELLLWFISQDCSVQSHNDLEQYLGYKAFQCYLLSYCLVKYNKMQDRAISARVRGEKDTFFLKFIFISWMLITLQYRSGFCHTLTWISHGYTCIPHPDPPFYLPLHPIPLGLPSAPGLSTCLMHPTMEYYSAIKKNSFESVLMRWMKLEPIIQSEVSQKDKDHYSILTHIYGI